MQLSMFQRKQLVLMRQMESELSVGTTPATIVPMQTDYASDPQLCLTLLKTPLPPHITKRILDRLVSPLVAIEPDFYYYSDKTLHMTIQTIRKVHNPPQYTPAHIARVKTLLTKEIHRHGPFTFDLSGVMSLPTSAAIIALGSFEYTDFILSLRQKLKDADVSTDQTYYRNDIVFANCTICRYTHRPSRKFLATLKKLRDEHIGTCVIDDVSFVETNAGVDPAKTTVFGTYRFKKNHG